MAFTTPILELIERNPNGLLGKHPSWGRVRLGDVATVQNGAAFKSEYFNTEGRGLPLLRIRDVVRGKTETWYDGPYDEAYIVNPGDLVIGMDGDFNHALWNGPPALLNQRVCRLVLHSRVVTKEWVLHVLGGYLRAINDATPSVTVKHLSSRTVADVLLPLPPKDDQMAAVTKLSDVLELIATGRRCFEDARRGLATYRRTLLQKEVSHLEATTLGEVADVVSGVTKGRRTKAPVSDYPFLRAANLRDGFLDLAEIKTIAATEREAERYRLEPGDVLMVEGSGSPDRLGQGWVWSGEVNGCLHQNHVFRARPDQSRVRPDYLAWVLQSPAAKAYFRRVAKTTAGLTTVNKREVSQLPVPLPALGVQERVAETLDATRTAVAQADRALMAQAEASTALERAIRREAVEGLLVPPSAGAAEEVAQLAVQVAAEKAERDAAARRASKKRRAVPVES